MAVFKLAIAGILAAAAGGALLIEQAHRTVIEAPGAADVSQMAAAVCPDNDTMPYDARCLEFLKVPGEAAPRVHVALQKEPVEPAPCPDSDKVPYSASCIAFLKGATETGMRWRADESPPAQR